MLRKFFAKKDNDSNIDDCDCDKVTLRDIFSVIGTQLLLLAFILLAIWGTQKIYTTIDQATFPDPYPLNITADMTENQKGIELLNAITSQLQTELDSTFGWTANDIIFNKYILDNRAYRQFGVYNATKTILDFYSTDIAKLGSADKENDNLYEARMNQFALSPGRWGFLFIPSAESAYKKGLNLLDEYEQDLLAGKAVYNLRTDDIHNGLELILGDRLLGYAIGMLQNSTSESFTAVDNNIYEVQGMAIVIRNFFSALYALYPDMINKNNEQNYESAMFYLNKICDYDPLIVTQTFNSSELMISYLLFARNRIEDIMESIKI